MGSSGGVLAGQDGARPCLWVLPPPGPDARRPRYHPSVCWSPAPQTRQPLRWLCFPLYFSSRHFGLEAKARCLLQTQKRRLFGSKKPLVLRVCVSINTYKYVHMRGVFQELSVTGFMGAGPELPPATGLAPSSPSLS